MISPHEAYRTAIHEAGHGFIALVSNSYQKIRLEIDLTTGRGSAATEHTCPMEVLGGMAAQLAFGEFWHEAVRGGAADLEIFQRRWPDRDWREVLPKSIRLIEKYKTEVASIALLLRRLTVVTQDECLPCMLDPLQGLARSGVAP